MTIPGFTADKVLSGARTRYGNVVFVDATFRMPMATPQFVGSQHCHWECIPGTGCGYFCEFLPF
jgi:hypothetical protein